MTRINVVPVQELHRVHLVSEYREIVRVFSVARKAQYEIHKKRIPNEYTLGTGHVLFFANKLKYITNRYNALCEEMVSRGYTCNRVSEVDLIAGIDRTLFWNYVPTEAALAVNRARINERLNDKEMK